MADADDSATYPDPANGPLSAPELNQLPRRHQRKLLREEEKTAVAKIAVSEELMRGRYGEGLDLLRLGSQKLREAGEAVNAITGKRLEWLANPEGEKRGEHFKGRRWQKDVNGDLRARELALLRMLKVSEQYAKTVQALYMDYKKLPFESGVTVNRTNIYQNLLSGTANIGGAQVVAGESVVDGEEVDVEAELRDFEEDAD